MQSPDSFEKVKDWVYWRLSTAVVIVIYILSDSNKSEIMSWASEASEASKRRVC